MRLVVVLLLLVPLGVMSSFEVNLVQHLRHFTTQRFPSDRFNTERLKAQKYIKDRFKSYGLKVVEQKFNSTIESDPLGIGNVTNVVGVNIIGISEAVSNRQGAVLLVGADYDTNGISDPIFNNGAGVAAMLETARLFTSAIRSKTFAKNFTTIFVAFDLNTKEHDIGSGRPGGWHFVQHWLWPYLKHSDINFGGAFILDSIMNINLNSNSQIANDDFRQLFPKTFERVVESERKGNFLAMVTRLGNKATTLKDQFSGSYYMERIRTQFRLEDMGFKGRMELNEVMRELTKPESIHFWSFNYNHTSVPLPAVLLTDTQELRVRPPMPAHCNKECPMKDLVTEDRVDFMDSTVRGLTRTLIRRQLHRYPDVPGGGELTLPSLLVTAAVFALVRLLQ
ncbi:uncharacterized protein [Panulirus ornatus]|uniref:uncharacterized protein n=1 Tax=Panulirus ornatus TaxID=150431 RepID=UPI003A86D10E